MIGKLKRTLREKCPECGSLLQLREVSRKELYRGIQVTISEEIVVCSNKNCFYEKEIEQKRRRRQEDDF